MAKISLLINSSWALMVIFKKRDFLKKQKLLDKLKDWIGKIVSLSLVATTVALIGSTEPGQVAFAQSKNDLKLQAISLDDINAESLEHLLTTPLRDLAGNTHRISDYGDKVVVLNFWASWCPPCIEEMPDLQQIDNDFDKVQVIGYGVDIEQNIRRFLNKVTVDFRIFIGEPTAIRMMRQLGNPSGGLPFTLIFTPDTQLAYKIIGQVNIEELRKKLAKLGS